MQAQVGYLARSGLVCVFIDTLFHHNLYSLNHVCLPSSIRSDLTNLGTTWRSPENDPSLNSEMWKPATVFSRWIHSCVGGMCIEYHEAAMTTQYTLI